MRAATLLSLASLVVGAPQGYTGDTAALDDSSLDKIQEIFGKVSVGGYGDSGELNAKDDEPVDVLVQVVQESFPSDYTETNDNLVEDKATVEVDNVFENCHEYTEQFGYECVPYYQCHNGTIITDGAGLIDIRNGFGALTPEDSKCPGFLDVCCKDPDFIPPPPPKVRYNPQCGRRNINGLGARIQGFTESESQFGEWPHMCAVLHAKPAEQAAGYVGEPETVNLYQCGGSLIAPGVVLTAAHCVDKFRQNPSELKIRCGEWDTQQETEPYPHQDRMVAALDIHPEFEARNLRNDFAVLFTSEEFVLSSHIDTACLPHLGESFDGTTCFATGWGKDKFGAAGEYQLVLKEIDLPVVNHDDCQDKLRQTRLGKKFKLDDSFVCAGGINGKDTCKGDGGSPLVCPSTYDPNTYIQAGIVAWGVGCGEDGTPGVYADVSQATCWIDSAISCYYGATTGSSPSYFGYTSDVCQVWLESKINDLEKKRDGAGKFGKIFQAMIDRYTKCQVEWQEPNAPIIDPAPPRSIAEQVDDSYANNNDDSYNTNEKIVEVDDSYNTNEKIIEADDSYNTNEKIVEVDDSYNTNEKIVEVDDSYNTNEKIVEVEDSYQTNEEIVEVDAPYDTNEKIVEVDNSYNTNEKIVEVDDSYNTNEKIVDVTNPVTCASEVKVNPNLSENLKGENPEGPQPY
jgi:hypothetical protein